MTPIPTSPTTKMDTHGIVIPDCLGLPVRHDPKLRFICDSRGIRGWREIVVGNEFLKFPAREQAALLLHEAGHCKAHHVEKRLLNLWRLLWPPAMARYCREQEFMADRYVAGCGYGSDLARAFARMTSTPSWSHPRLEERIARLIGANNLT